MRLIGATSEGWVGLPSVPGLSVPNHGVQPTPSGLRSCVAPAFGDGSPRPLEAHSRMERRVSHKTSRYCWPTPKCRNLCVQHAFVEGKKAKETFPRKSTPRTLKLGRLRARSISGLFSQPPAEPD